MSAQQEKWIRWAGDGLALAVLLALGLVMWFTPAGGPDLPAWATGHDLVLDGPDAGEWAINAMRVARGDLASVDAHRMPAWLVAVALVSNALPDIAQAGHFVNHTAFLLLPLVLYGLGRADNGPATGLIAGMLALGCMPLIKASDRYGVDPFVAVVLPMTLLLALPVRRRFWLAPIAGLFAGYAALSHFTALPYVLPAALLILLRGPTPRWWHRLAGFALYAVSALFVVYLAEWLVDLIDPWDLVGAVSEGIDKADTAGPRHGQLSTGALETLEMGRSEAAGLAIQNGLEPFWQVVPVPWPLLAVLPWLGAVGAGLGTAKGPGRWRFARWFDGSLGLTLVCCLAPLPVLAAAGAEPRYASNLLPFVAVLVARGLGSLPGVIELGLREKWAWFPRGVLALPLVLWIGLNSWRAGWEQRQEPQPVDNLATSARELGLRIEANFPGGGGAASPIREAAAYAGRDYCPTTACPFGNGKGWFEQCIAAVRSQCSGDGPIPYVVIEEGPIGMGDSANVQAMGAWVVEKYEVVDTMTVPRFKATIVAIPRASEPLGEPPELPNPDPEGPP
ncbi:MAG: glycosyltransferase family 39 protein [Proteobacteria bacterium]|nr:glycosyltransferase family 39 protein [Pseudomonadota bacterium]MCP4920569.1 glycosyltransferase family 39 protein [Pseudomonadota bacterium]